MLDHEDLKWIATTSTELNTRLQQIARYADLLRQHKSEQQYVDALTERVEIASKAAQAIFDRVTSKILAATSGKTISSRGDAAAPTLTVLPDPGTATEPPVKPQLPAQPTRKMPPAASAQALEIPADVFVLNREGARELLLLVEDEPEIGALAAEMLADEGYKVITAKDGFEALKIYQRIGSQIGLVILDFFLPVMDGDAVFDELRSLNPSVNVVLSSGFAEQSKIGNMLAQGLRGFIPKPYTREKLVEQVSSILEAARQGA